MRLQHTLLISIGTALALLASGCGIGGSGIRITESDQPVGDTATRTATADSATLVHVDTRERIVTIRNGRKFPDGFLIASDRNGTQSAVLKTRPRRPIGLRTAYILEGDPSINDTVVPAGSEESERLEKLYPESESESEAETE